VDAVSSADFQTLTDDEIAAYKRQARKTLVGSGYNLFAEITLRLIEHYHVQLAESMNVRGEGMDRGIESDILSQENIELQAQLSASELERKLLQAQVEHLQREVERLQRRKWNVPPSLKS
jgi:hypothetical protein